MCRASRSRRQEREWTADRVMFRLAYRNFGDHESLVVNHTVKGGPLAGVRWYEIRNPSAPLVYQQSTVIDPNVNYWLGSIAMDKTGHIALGFSVSSLSVFPSFRKIANCYMEICKHKENLGEVDISVVFGA